MDDIVINNVLNSLDSTDLETLDSVKLMNRMETKFLFSADKLAPLIMMLGGRYKILEINSNRAFPYLTTYFDTADYLFYNQHVRGEFDRFKIRFRHYEFTDDSFLEIKKKNNKGRTIKRRILNTPGPATFDSAAEDFIKSYSPLITSQLTPHLVNRFVRLTLHGAELNERITIDYNISFTDPDSKLTIAMPYLAIAEIKRFERTRSSPIAGALKKMQIHPHGFSKYCTGSAILKKNLKQNLLKPKILYLNRIKNEYYSANKQ